MKQFSCHEESHKSVLGHHSVQQPLKPHCFIGKIILSEAKPQKQLCLSILRKNYFSTFAEEREACFTDKILTGLNMVNKNLANN